MRKIFYFISAAAVAVLSSCTTDSIVENPVMETVPVTINVGTPMTKRVGTNSNDMLIKNFQIFVFTNTGKFELASNLITSDTQARLDLLPGIKHIWVVANIPAVISNPSNETAFKATSSSLLNNACDKIAMSGHAEPVITTETQVDVQLEHIACKIVLDKVTRNFTNADYGACPLTVKSVYISNVAGDTSIDCSAAPTTWCNQKGVINTGLSAVQKEMLVNDGINHLIAQGESYEAVHTFYAYPNPIVADSFADNWCARHTRLVIMCDYNGKTCYYPITLPKAEGSTPGTLQRNKVYHISQLTLKRPGSSSPDNPGDEVDSRVSVTFRVTVKDWDGDTSYTEVFE
ncbi:MAG: hypothetical protein K6E37_05770 [Bacteroidales bacterium]|nr:hypothetical protein [Bacteroidales bacterium]